MEYHTPNARCMRSPPAAAAAAGIVLLKNTAGTLPLLPAEDGAPLPVAVFGIRPAAHALHTTGR